MLSNADQFAQIFDGFSRAHGTFEITSHNDKKGKEEGKANTVRTPLTPDDWGLHLNGGTGLGVVPLRDDNTCLFAVIDVDDYQLSFKELEEKIDNHQLPLVICRSKSGGAHLYVFFENPVPAQDVVDNLKTWSSLIGVGGAEIFPKQTHRADIEKDVGNWINLPYFNANKTNRYAIKKGKQLSLKQFFNLVEKQKIKDINKVGDNDFDDNGLFEDGPPCLQRLAKYENGSHEGFGEGERNNGMYNVGIYLRKRYPDTWQHELQGYNEKMCDPPLSMKEIQIITGSLKKREYEFKCKERPICDFCNKKECRSRKYGVGDTVTSGDMPVFGSIEKYPGDPVIWVLEIDGQRVDFQTEDLFSIPAFNKVCMEKIHRVPVKVNQKRWQEFLDELIQQVIEHPHEKEAYREGQFWVLVNIFCSGEHTMATSKDQLIQGKPWYNPKDGRVYFMPWSLTGFLNEQKFKHEPNQVWKILRQNGGESGKQRIKNKVVHVWSIPYEEEIVEDNDKKEIEFGTEEF